MMKLPKSLLNLFGKPKVDPEDQAVRVAITSMASLPQWPDFLLAIANRREQWLADSKSPQVYQNHAELVAVTARAAECDYFLELFSEATKSVTDDSGPR